MLRDASKIMIGFLAFLFLFGGPAIGEEKFGGVGLKISQLFDTTAKTKAGELVVLEVLSGTDAHTKGILHGDIITKIDQASTKDADFGMLIAKLRGSIGSEVVLEVKRAGMQKALTFKIKRSEIVYSE